MILFNFFSGGANLVNNKNNNIVINNHIEYYSNWSNKSGKQLANTKEMQ